MRSLQNPAVALDSLDVGRVPERRRRAQRRDPNLDIERERYDRRAEDPIPARFHNVDFYPESDRGRDRVREQDRKRDPPRPSSRPRDRDARGSSRHREKTESKRAPSPPPPRQTQRKREPSPSPTPRPDPEPPVAAAAKAKRDVTPEKQAAVLRILRCEPTAFYEILQLPRTCTDAEVKKAYRKLSLLTHPDKNGHEQADEAFKVVARAFGILGDKEKRDRYDETGMDPDDRMANMKTQTRTPDRKEKRGKKHDRSRANPDDGFANAQGRGAQGGKERGQTYQQYEWAPDEDFATRNESRAEQNPFAGFEGRRAGGGDGRAFAFNNDGAGEDPLDDDLFKRRRERTFGPKGDTVREDPYGPDVFGDDPFSRRRPRMPSFTRGSPLDDDVYQRARMSSYMAREMDEVDRMMRREGFGTQFMGASPRFGQTAPERATGFNNYPAGPYGATPGPYAQTPDPRCGPGRPPNRGRDPSPQRPRVQRSRAANAADDRRREGPEPRRPAAGYDRPERLVVSPRKEKPSPLKFVETEDPDGEVIDRRRDGRVPVERKPTERKRREPERPKWR